MSLIEVVKMDSHLRLKRQRLTEILQEKAGENWQHDPSPIAGIYRLFRDYSFPIEAIDSLLELCAMQGRGFEDRAKILYVAYSDLMCLREWRTEKERRQNRTTMVFAEMIQDQKQKEQLSALALDHLEGMWREREGLEPQEVAMLRAELRKRMGIV